METTKHKYLAFVPALSASNLNLAEFSSNTSDTSFKNYDSSDPLALAGQTE